MQLFSTITLALFLFLAVFHVEGFGSVGDIVDGSRTSMDEATTNAFCLEWKITCETVGSTSKGQAACREFNTVCGKCTCFERTSCSGCGATSGCTPSDATGDTCRQLSTWCRARVQTLTRKNRLHKKNKAGKSCAIFKGNDACCAGGNDWTDDWTWQGDGGGGGGGGDLLDVCDPNNPEANPGPDAQQRVIHKIESGLCVTETQTRERPCDRNADPVWGPHPPYDDNFQPCSPCNPLSQCCLELNMFAQKDECEDLKKTCGDNSPEASGIAARDNCWNKLSQSPPQQCGGGCDEFMQKCGYSCAFK